MKYPRVPIGMMLNHFFTRPRFPVKDGRDDATQGQDATDEVDGFMLARGHELGCTMRREGEMKKTFKLPYPLAENNESRDYPRYVR